MYTDELIGFFAANSDFYEHLVLPIREQRTTLFETMNPVFFNEINKQYFDRIKWVIVSDIAYRLSHIPTDEILMFMESINLETF